MPQLVGSRCTLCEQRIDSILEGQFCQVCAKPCHNRCRNAATPSADPFKCSGCGSAIAAPSLPTGGAAVTGETKKSESKSPETLFSRKHWKLLAAAFVLGIGFSIYRQYAEARGQELIEYYDKWKGLIVILIGVYSILLAKGVLPRKPKDPERMELWRRKFGRLFKILGPIVIVIGICQLLGAFR
jgi:hypothetical protein